MGPGGPQGAGHRLGRGPLTAGPLAPSQTRAAEPAGRTPPLPPTLPQPLTDLLRVRRPGGRRLGGARRCLPAGRTWKPRSGSGGRRRRARA